MLEDLWCEILPYVEWMAICCYAIVFFVLPTLVDDEWGLSSSMHNWVEKLKSWISKRTAFEKCEKGGENTAEKNETAIVIDPPCDRKKPIHSAKDTVTVSSPDLTITVDNGDEYPEVEGGEAENGRTGNEN